MQSLTRWKGLVVGLIGLILSLTGVKAAQAEATVPSQPIAQDTTACPESWQERETYARVVTQRDPLRIRATPNGRVIGSVPRGWAVVVLERDPSGRWTKITSHFGDPEGLVFGSAPYFQEGWVSSQFLRNLGDFCEKPMAMGANHLFTTAQSDIAQDDWLQLGDHIAQAHRPD